MVRCLPAVWEVNVYRISLYSGQKTGISRMSCNECHVCFLSSSQGTTECAAQNVFGLDAEFSLDASRRACSSCGRPCPGCVDDVFWICCCCSGGNCSFGADVLPVGMLGVGTLLPCLCRTAVGIGSVYLHCLLQVHIYVSVSLFVSVPPRFSF